MIRMNVLRNCPVICHARRVGLLQHITLNQSQKTVRALIVSGGLKGKRVVIPENVLAVTSEFILVKQTEPYDRSIEIDPYAFVRDTTGSLIGKVSDYLLDEQELKVLAAELTEGYFHAGRGARKWLYTYAPSEQWTGEIIVPSDISCEPKG